MPRATYPRPWIATGHGSYRELRRGEFELKFRDEHGQRHPVIPCTAEEAAALIEIRTRNRRRIAAGLPAVTTWDQALSSYETYKKARGNTEKTIRQAVDALKALRDHAAEHPANIQPLHIQNWLSDYAIAAQAKQRRGWAATCNQLRRQIFTFFRWLKNNRLTTENVVESVPPFKARKKPDRDLTMEEFKKLRRVCEPSLRDLLNFMVLTGARLGEIANMRRADVDDRGVWSIPKRKRDVPLKITLSPALLEVVFRQKPDANGRLWRRCVKPNPETTYGCGLLELGGEISSGWFRDCMAYRCAKAKIPTFSAHALRHAKGSWHDELGIDLRVTQRALGHTNIATTQRYAHGQMSQRVLQAQEQLYEKVKDPPPIEAKLWQDDDDLGDAREA